MESIILLMLFSNVDNNSCVPDSIAVNHIPLQYLSIGDILYFTKPLLFHCDDDTGKYGEI